MRRRVFYVVNLDRGRLVLLGIGLAAVMLAAFAVGLQMGRAREAALRLPRPQPSALLQETPTDELETGASADADLAAALSRREAEPFAEGASGAEQQHTAENIAGEAPERLALANLPAIDPAAPAIPERRSTRELAPRELQRSEPVRRETTRRESTRRETARRETARRETTRRETARRETTRRETTRRETTRRETTRRETRRSAARSEENRRDQSAPARPAASPENDSIRLANTASTPASSAAEERRYSLQLGAFRSNAAAARMAEQLRGQGFEPVLRSSGDRHLVRVGRAGSRAELSALEQKLRARNYAPVRVRE